jgi:MFS family permease
VSIIADAFPRRRLGAAMSVYMLGIFFGSGVSYALGAWITSKQQTTGVVMVPLIGAVHPWQTVFFIIGLPGLLVALLAMTMPEPARTAGDRASAQVPLSQVMAYLQRNARTMTALCTGYMLSASVNWGMGYWLILFFVRTHHWTLAQAGALQGGLTLALGPVGTLLGGWLVDRYRQRGVIDAPLRVGMLGAAGMLVFAGAYPAMPSAMVAAALLVPVNIFAALPWGAANVAIAEAMPSRMRGQGSAIFQLILGLSGGIGPTAVALVTDHVFGNDAALRWSLMVVTMVGMTLTLIILAWGLPAYRATVLARDESRERAIASV